MSIIDILFALGLFLVLLQPYKVDLHSRLILIACEQLLALFSERWWFTFILLFFMWTS